MAPRGTGFLAVCGVCAAAGRAERRDDRHANRMPDAILTIEEIIDNARNFEGLRHGRD